MTNKKLTIAEMRNEIAKINKTIREIKLEHKLLFGGVENHKNGQLLQVRDRMWKREVAPAFNKITAKRDEVKEAYDRAQWILKSYKKLTA